MSHHQSGLVPSTRVLPVAAPFSISSMSSEHSLAQKKHLAALPPLEQAIAICGSQAELARRINESSQTVSAWRNRTRKSGVVRVPAAYCPAIEEATGGQVTCEQLNPEVKWSVLRGHQRRGALRSQSAPSFPWCVGLVHDVSEQPCVTLKLRDVVTALQSLKMLIDMQAPGAVVLRNGDDVRKSGLYQQASDVLFRLAPEYFECVDGQPVVTVMGFTVARLGLDAEGTDGIQHQLDLIRDVSSAMAEHGVQILRATRAQDLDVFPPSPVQAEAVKQPVGSGQGCQP